MMEFEREMVRARRERLLRQAQDQRLAGQARQTVGRAARAGFPAIVRTVRQRLRSATRRSWLGLWARTMRRA